MTGEEVYLKRAEENIRAARLLLDKDLTNIAAARAYYAMFYVAELLLQRKGLNFSSHAAVIAAFGKEFARTGEIDPKFHRLLIASQNARQIGDYGGEENIDREEAVQVLGWAEEFLQAAKQFLSKPE